MWLNLTLSFLSCLPVSISSIRDCLSSMSVPGAGRCLVSIIIFTTEDSCFILMNKTNIQTVHCSYYCSWSYFVWRANFWRLQEALKSSPEFCLKLTYRYLLKVGHVNVDTWGQAIFGPRGIIWTNLVDDHYVMLHTNYQGSRPYGLRQEDFSMFPPYKPMSNLRPPRAGQFLVPGG